MDQEKISKLLLRFAMPAMAGMVAGAIYNIVDRIFVGQFVGADGLASITLAFPTMLIMFSFSLLISVGGSSRVSILRGARKQRPAEQALAHTFMLLTVLGVIGSLLSFCNIDYILGLSGASDKILPSARTYLKIILLGTPFALLGNGMNALIRACGSPSYAMGTQIFGALANVALDALFIVWLGMGVMGAALGTIIAQALAMICGFAFFFFHETPLKIRLHFFLKPRFKVIKKICAVGSAPFMMELSFAVFMVLTNRYIHRYGGDIGLSAMGVFLSLDSLLFLPAMAIGEATQPIVGYNYGAGRPDRVLKAIKCSLILVTCFYIVSFLCAQIFTEEMIRLFNDDPALVAIGVPGMRIGYIGVVFMGISIVANSALLGLGKAKESIVLSFCRHLLFMYIPIFILPRFFGLWGIWFAFPTADICGGLLALIFLNRLVKWLRTPEALIVK